ncbi:MAG: tRNA dihydrouridine(20/20a) synthase DusA [Rhodospirillaceae bacterium]|jgi:tRNA-dihydrouridine synthase A|nr:tRNA dihydrouridine(20/20a) synthase DusA [Rhodospirillaceae bacterium]MBT4691169.1 tRNA dihydrouridine(20/20a) synthase DusA [Rhodospirillaceae bacterium]MBT5080878.1 tRNA dihydrouridine(20/20a) synthase DusA [Rhodospirillaceae bacterium]MBT5525299.1 tRNA dihydrouridine(20/20a) synthase DusA [Rhodospirillaceae bacterium]MBT5877868.1 tRNA dihydrouridine(20/20a) synthase DusA [Rhodospirillaceae bacterium]
MTQHALKTLNRRFCVAPMMEYTDRHERYFLRQISRHALLYTEMVTAEAVIHGDKERLLGFSDAEHPIALQLGGSDPARMTMAAEIGQSFGYDEVNINVGCPSDRVQSGRFGACLMAEPELVAASVKAMTAATDLPITVKSRIGIDDQDSYDFLRQFVETVAAAGCTTFIVHARKAILSGLSPKQNREVPPLDYDRVYRLKSDYPQLEIIINGGIENLEQCQTHLAHLDGVMVGRAAYQSPYMMAPVDRDLYGDSAALPSRSDLVHAMLPYIAAQMARGVRLNAISRHMLGLYYGQPGARTWRRYISERSHLGGAAPGLLEDALAQMPIAA